MTTACPTCGHTSRAPRAAKLITASSAACFRLCARRYQHAYVSGLRPIRTHEALRFGTAWHALMEQWWQRQPVTLPDVAGEAYEVAKLSAMLAAYDARWAALRDQHEVVAIEAPFRAPLLDGQGRQVRGWAIAGKIDGLLRRDGQTYLLEHKTTSEDVTTGSDYWASLTLDAQVSIYHDGAAALGHAPVACIYDVARKPQLRPSLVPVLDAQNRKVVLDAQGQRVLTQRGEPRQTADAAAGYVLQTRPETPEEYQARCLESIAASPNAYLAQAQIVRLDGELSAARDDLAGTARQIDQCAKAGSWPRNPRACFELGRCNFFGLCSGSESDGEFVRVDDVHPELANAA